MRLTTSPLTIGRIHSILFACVLAIVLGLLLTHNWPKPSIRPEGPTRLTVTRVALYSAFTDAMASYVSTGARVAQSFRLTPSQSRFMKSVYINTNIARWYEEIGNGKEVVVAAVEILRADGKTQWILFRMPSGQAETVSAEDERLRAILSGFAAWMSAGGFARQRREFRRHNMAVGKGDRSILGVWWLFWALSGTTISAVTWPSGCPDD